MNTDEIGLGISRRRNQKIVCFGELLFRICPDTGNQWLSNNSVSIYVAGAEANTATDLALWGIPVTYVTALPDNFLTTELMHYFRLRDVDTSHVLRHGERMGIFYLPKGKDIKNASIIYDRKDSALSQLKPGMLDWNDVFRDASWLHVSAITPALSDNVFQVCLEAFQAASEKNVMISIDLNYRAKLWEGRDPQGIMQQLLPYCDVVMGNIWSAEKMLDVPVTIPAEMPLEKRIFLQKSELTSREIIERFPRVKLVANTFRFEEGEKGINYYGTLYAGQRLFVSKEYHAKEIVDRVGSGDCFMAGLIFACVNGYSLQEIVDFATAAAFSKLFVESDVTTKSVDEVKEFVKRGH